MLKKACFVLAFSLFAVSLFIGLDRLCHRHVKRYFLDSITTSNQFSAKWGSSFLSEEEKKNLHQILNQKFVFYGHGSHAYVCMSEDGQYILKLLKHQQLKPKSWLACLRFSFNPFYQEFLSRKKKSEAVLTAWKTAAEELKKETGLIYMHMDNAQSLHQRVTILDHRVKEHVVDLNRAIFYVQRHAQLVYLRIAELMYNEDIEGAKGIISSIFSLIDRLNEVGVLEERGGFECNFGLVEDLAIQVDVGGLCPDPAQKTNLSYQQKMMLMTESLQEWLKKNYPELYSHFQTCLANASKKVG